MLAATVATLSSASKRPAPSSASPSGTTLAQGSQSQPPQRSHTCQNSSPRAPVRPDPATGFAPLTIWGHVDRIPRKLSNVRSSTCDRRQIAIGGPRAGLRAGGYPQGQGQSRKLTGG